MNRKISWMFFAALLVTMLVGSPVYSQTAGTVKANIPFEFRIGNERLSAGVYVISSIYGARVTLKNAEGSKSMILMTNDVQANHASSEGKLVFKRYGDLYFLSQIWTGGEEVGRSLLKSSAEKEVASRILASETNILIAGKSN